MRVRGVRAYPAGGPGRQAAQGGTVRVLVHQRLGCGQCRHATRPATSPFRPSTAASPLATPIPRNRHIVGSLTFRTGVQCRRAGACRCRDARHGYGRRTARLDCRPPGSTRPRRRGLLTLRVIAGARRYTAPAAALAIGHQVGEALVPVVMGYGIDNAVRTGDARDAPDHPWHCSPSPSAACRTASVSGRSSVRSAGRPPSTSCGSPSSGASSIRGRWPAGAICPGEALSLATSDVQNLSTAVLLGGLPGR